MLAPSAHTARRLTAAGFTLVELAVVVMILGMLAAMAAPKLIGMSQKAVDNGLRHTLSVIREAIDNFSAEHPGQLPGEDGLAATFKSDLAPFLRGGEFPTCTVGPAKNSAVHMISGTDVSTALSATKATHSWLYDYVSGEFYVNSDELSPDGATLYVEF